MNRNIVCIGAGYIGGPTMAVIASKNPDRKVIVVDISQERIDAWNSPDYSLPIYEPGLVDVIKQVRGKNLFFSTDIKKAVQECDIIFVGVNTPTKMFGRGKGRASDLQFWEATARNIKQWAKSDKIVVEKSTLPVRTAAAMSAILNAEDATKDVQINKRQKPSCSPKFTVLSNPEFLAEGTAIKDLLCPDRVLIGGPDTPEGKSAVDELIDIYLGTTSSYETASKTSKRAVSSFIKKGGWVPREKILTTNVWSAELTKLAANAMLAQRVSSVNALAGLCEATGADIDEVTHVMGADHRIGSKFLKAGPGFGGSCFKKDVLNLVYLCEAFGLHTAAEYWSQVIKMNDHQQERIVSRLFNAMFNTIANKKIAMFGFAFKANTGDTRESPAATVAKLLIQEHVRLAITDPKALDNARRDLANLDSDTISTGGSAAQFFKQPPIEFVVSPYDAAKDADAVILMTDWEEYKTLDWKKIYASMRKPALVFDTRNCLNSQELRAAGFTVLGIGR